MTRNQSISRRQACQILGVGLVSALWNKKAFSSTIPENASLRYALASSLFGVAPLEEVLAVTKATGTDVIDLWPLRHGNQREQVDEMGEEKFRALLERFRLKLGLTTRFDLEPDAMEDEMKFVSRFGGSTIVTGAARVPKGKSLPVGEDLKEAVAQYCRSLKPVSETAQRYAMTVSIENHSSRLLWSPDAIRYFADGLRRHRLRGIGIAFAPYHLPQEADMLGELVTFCAETLTLFYAWQHGKGSMDDITREEQFLQLPGRGPLDFTPMLKALKKIDFKGYVEIFMHPFPRGVPIADTIEESVKVLNESRKHLENLPYRSS